MHDYEAGKRGGKKNGEQEVVPRGATGAPNTIPL